MKHYGDITQIRGDAVEPVDVITGGSPCQDLSVAGKRAGLAGARSGLFMEQIRLIKEMRKNDELHCGRTGESVRPRFMVFENVPGLFSSNGGEDFRAVLEETARVVAKDAVIPRPEKWSYSGCIMGDGWSIAWRTHDAQFWGVPQRRKRIALVADFGGTAAPEILFERKSMSRNTEQGEQTRKGTSANFENGTCPTIARSLTQGADVYNGHLTGELAVTLTSACGGTNTSGQKVMYRRQGVSDNSEKRIGIESAISFQERAGKPGGGKGILIQDERTGALSTLNNQSVFCLQGNGIDRKPENGCNGKGWTKDKSYTLNTIVRRLIPKECERLQGFPDDWTNIGEWIDSKGKRHKDADSPRYKAIGNSIALPFWQWLAERIAKHLPKNATMASLFDGIGGFPLVFSRCGIKPVWASEIEEFPIAVTKIRFPED